MKNQPLEMKIPTPEMIYPPTMSLGSDNFSSGRLIHDFRAFELSGFEEGVELKSYGLMQRLTNGPLDDIKTIRSIEGWRMRMRREFMGWGTTKGRDCWDYIPVDLRLWCDKSNPSPMWRETPVLFLWRCHLWQARLRGCRETPICPPDPEKEISLWDEDYGWIYTPIYNKVVWTRRNRFNFEDLPPDVAEYLQNDWIVRWENPSTPPIWDENYNPLDQVETRYRFDPWTGPENWFPTPLRKDKVLFRDWKKLQRT